MATRESSVVTNDKKQTFDAPSDHDPQYSNFKLNQTYEVLNANTVHSKSNSFNDKKQGLVSDYIDSKENRHHTDFKLLNKTDFDSCPNSPELLKRCDNQKEMKESNSKNINNSTLSLHIAAYENATEASDFDKTADSGENFAKKCNTFESAGILEGVAQNSFEFPRQQKDEATKPEVMQFKASQKLFNSKSSTSTSSHDKRIPQQRIPSMSEERPIKIESKADLRNIEPIFTMAQTDPDSSVKVAIRIRPLVSRELARGDRTVTTVNEFEHQLTIGGKATFTFDHVFDCNTAQSSVYTNCVNNLVEGIFDGYNATVLAYGQTGSGKTHTMGTGMDLTGNIPPDDLGIVPRAVQHIFDGIELRKKQAQESGILPPTFEVTVTFVELYNENIFDLLNNGKDRTKITMYEDPATNEIQLSGVKNLTVKSPEDLMEALRSGALNRTVGATNMNEQSSRSHAIFSIYLKQQRPCQTLDADSAANTTVDFEFLTAKFHFVDLAGSERIAKTGATGARAKEGCNINMGLLMLGNVIKALADKEQVNYRMSKLTRLLKDSLGGNSRTLMIACASPSECDFVETYNTMQYANRTKNIKNKVVANQDKSSRLIADLRRKITELETELLEFKSGKKAINTDGAVISTDADIENAALLAEVNKLNTKVKALQDALDQSKKRNVSLQQQNIQELARQYDKNGEAGEDSIAVMASKYIEEIEVLKNDLSEAHFTIEDLRKQVARLKTALTSRGSAAIEVASPSGANYHDVSEPSDVSNLLKHLKDEIDEKKKKYEEVESVALKRVLPTKSRNGSVTSLSLQDEEGRISVDDEEELETADEDSEDEEEQIATEEKERLCDELTQLQDDINVKLQLVNTLERSEQRLIAIKAEYEKKMSNLLERITQTEKERNQMIEKLSSSNTGKSNTKETEKKIKEVKDQYEEKLNGLKKEFKKFKDMERNHQRMVEQQKRQQQDLERYRREVDAMKKSKVDLMKKINQESKVIQERERAQQKKMASMTKEARKRELKIQQLEMKERQREEFLKRKNEEYSRKLHQAGMEAKINIIKKTQTPIASTPKSAKHRNARSKINWEVIEKNIFKQVSQRQMYEKCREQLESKVAERQQLEKAIEDLNKNFLQLKNVAERQAVTEQLQSYKEKTDYLDNEINELRQEIIGADDEDASYGSSSNVDIEKAIDNCKSLEDAKFLCKRLAQLSIEQGLTAVKAEQTNKVLSGELEYFQKNCVEADDIVHSFMETNEDRDAISPVENVSNRQNKVRQKTGTSNDLLFPGSIMNQTVTFGGPGGDACNETYDYKPIKKEIRSSRQEKPHTQKAAREALKEKNGDNNLTEPDDDTLDSASVSESFPVEKTQQFKRYSADKIAKFSDAFVGHSNTIYSLSASEEYLVSGAKDRKAFVWDLNTGKKIRELSGHPATIKAVKIVPQSQLIITGSAFYMRVWDLRTGTCQNLLQSSGIVSEDFEHYGRRTYIPPGEDEIRAFDVDSTGQYLFSNTKGSVRCWDLRKPAAYGRISGDDAFPISSICVQSAEDASGHVQIFCGHSGSDSTSMKGKGSVSIWKTPLGQISNNLPITLPFDYDITDVIPDGKVFFCCDVHGNVLRYSTVDSKREAVVARSTVSSANKLCFVRSPVTNGSLLAAGYQDGMIKFFDYEGRQGLKEEGKLSADLNKVTAITSNSKQMFFTSGKDISVFNIVYNPS